MLQKSKDYLKSFDFIEDLILSIAPPLILGVLFYSNNSHLVSFDGSVFRFLRLLSFLFFIWIVLTRKIFFLKYAPLGFSFGFCFLLLFNQLIYKNILIYGLTFVFAVMIYFLRKYLKIMYIFIFFLISTQIIQGYFKNKQQSIIENLNLDITKKKKQNKQNNTKQNKTKQYNTIQYNTIQYNTIQYNTIQYNTTSQSIKNKKNVYYLVSDGYSSFETFLKQDYIDNREFLNELKKRDFWTNENAYSNYARTWTSMQATFQMKHNYYKDMNIYSTETPDSKYIVRGLNPVISRFYDNGYDVYITPYKTPEELKKKNKNYEKWNGMIQKKVNVGIPRQDIVWFFSYFKRIKSSITDFIASAVEESVITKSELKPLPLEKVISKKIKYDVSNKFFFSNVILNIKSKNPKFIYLHNTNLLNEEVCLDSETKDNYYRKGTIKKLTCINNDILLALDIIIKNDPDSIIILQADHGCCPQRSEYGDGSGFVKNGYSVKYIEKNSEIQKKFGILFSVRWPEECKYLGEEKYTPINLFPRVFACLNGEKPDYQKMEKDDSYLIGAWYFSGKKELYEVFKVIENNEILPEFQ